MALALITGASSGIGAACAKMFVDAGYQVVLVARSKEKLASVAHPLGNAAQVYPCDLGDPDAVLALVDKLRTEVGVPESLFTLQEQEPGKG